MSVIVCVSSVGLQMKNCTLGEGEWNVKFEVFCSPRANREQGVGLVLVVHFGA